MYEVGYITGTFDIPHAGHFAILEKCKSFCNKLIVGLVSDDLGIKQKRKPVLKYDHRKTILENSKWVDFVVIFEGTSKKVDYKKLNFDVLFTSDEYLYAEEYEVFKDTPIYYFPRTIDISTSDIFKDMVRRVIEEASLFSSGTGGDILKLKWKNNESYIVKPVNMALCEVGKTSNVFKFPVPPPRNWKLLGYKGQDLPFLSGVNPNREIEICKVLYSVKWFLVEDVMFKQKNEEISYLGQDDNVNSQRKFGRVAWLIQRDGGETLSKVLENAIEETRREIYIKVKNIIEKMRKMGVLHMDLHANNIVVKDGNIGIIDFGWCMHYSFDMGPEERSYYETKLKDNFDLKHFRESLVVMGIEDSIPSYLFQETDV